MLVSLNANSIANGRQSIVEMPHHPKWPEEYRYLKI